MTYSTISTIQQNVYQNTVDISSLQYEFSVLTTSSILAGIYSSFIDLEKYTTNIINSNYQLLFSSLGSTLFIQLNSTLFTTLGSTLLIEVTSTIYPQLESTLYTAVGSTINTTLESTLTYTIGSTFYETIGSTLTYTIGSTTYETVVSTLYTSLGSTLLTTLDSTLYTTVGSTLYTTLGSTLNSEITSTIYTDVISTLSLSTLYTSQTINLTGNEFIGIMDMASYRNFDVNIFGVIDNLSTYQLTYVSNAFNSNYEYNQGNIFINVSTVGQTYTPNNSLLRLDVNRNGVLNLTNENTFKPILSNSDYTLHYGYTVYRNTVFTTLVDAYPRLLTYGLAVQNDFVPTVIGSLDGITPGATLPNYYWRGQQVPIMWSNYSFFPVENFTGVLPGVNVDVLVNGNTVKSYGPYPVNVSTAVISMPYLQTSIQFDGSSWTSPVLATQIRSYFVGKPLEASEYVANTVQPCIVRVLMTNSPGNFVMGNELQGFADTQINILSNTYISVTSDSLQTSYDDNPLYSASNLFDSDSMTNFVGPNDTFGSTNPDTNVRLQIPILPTATPFYVYDTLSSIVFLNNTDTVIPGGGATTTGNIITGYTTDGAQYYGSTFVLTNDIEQTFQL
jgi:hypothetical protein